jgi:beta-glucosidase
MRCDLNKYVAAILVVWASGAMAGFSETTAAASSSRHLDAAASDQECLARFLGVGKLPMAVGSPAAAIDGDQTTMWWSDASPRQEFTATFDAPWDVRSVEIEWGQQVPSAYEIQLTADGLQWETVFRADQFKNPATPHGKVAWVSDKLTVPFTAKALRIRSLEGGMDGVQIIDVYVNGSMPYSFAAVPETALYKNEAAPIDDRVKDLLGRMNFREKLRLTGGLNYFFIPGIERFGFHPVMMANASSGLKFQPTLPWDYKSLTQSTAFPLPVAIAATWDPELAFEMGAAIAKECRADGVSILLGPGVNIHRTSTCGRNFEYFSEDPFLSSRMAVMNIKGLQGEGVLATIKHYAVNNNEFLRTQSNVLVGERALNEIFLPSFRAAIEEADVKAVMSSYNWMNGEKCGESPALLDEILRKQLGFKGFVMSDWGGTTEDYAAQLISGQNIIMPQMKRFGEYVRTQRMAHPQETDAKLDAMIAPIVRVLLETGIWERPPASGLPVDFDAHDALARQIAESAITLLKNENVLPLQAGETILVVGEEGAVKRASSGGGSVKVDGYNAIDYLAGLEALYGNAVTYKENPTAGEVQAADCVLFFFTMRDHEGNDRAFELRPVVNRQIDMLTENNEKVIVVACTGTAFDTPWLEDVEGLVHSYFLGQSFGSALANVLSGAVNPSGKLPFTMEKSFSDSPAYGYNIVNGKEEWGGHFKGSPSRFDLPYEEGVFVGYRWYEAKNKPIRFPFGFGLSYTSFRMDNLKLSSDQITKDSPVTVRVDVTNTGKTAGSEVVQLYVHDDEAGVPRLYRELKGFKKVTLEPGQTCTVELPVTWNDLAFWDVQAHQWTVEKGTFTLLVGNSSRDVQGRAVVQY